MGHLRSGDYEAVLRLCSDVAGRPHPLERAEAFFRGYLALCGADTLGVVAAEAADGFYAVQGGLMWGLQIGAVDRLQEWYFQDGQDSQDPFNRALWQHGGKSRRRRDMISDQDWYSHEQVAEGWRWVGLDDTLGSAVPLSRGTAVLAAMREWGSRPFNARERELHQCLSVHFRWLLRDLQASGHLGQRPDGLPGRLEGVLRQLLQGRAEKQIAAELGLSPRTVNKYIEKIFRFYQVCSRAELMALWIPEPPAGVSLRRVALE